MNDSRRDFLKKSSLLALAGLSIPFLTNAAENHSQAESSQAAAITLPPLPYNNDALEPHIDTKTMTIHHTKHHQAYVDNLNKAIKDGNITASFDEMIMNVSKYPNAVRNNAGGHWNHSFFWKIMKPGGGGLPTGKIAEEINSIFGTFEAFKTKIEEAGTKRFGSGWAWLAVSNGKLQIGSTPNQDNPLMDVSEFKGTPVLGVDVWEHAYYLKYQNRRAEYLNAWWNVINWDAVNQNFELAGKK